MTKVYVAIKSYMYDGGFEILTISLKRKVAMASIQEELDQYSEYEEQSPGIWILRGYEILLSLQEMELT